MLCPNHHNKIFCEYSKHGIHTRKEQSIKITGWFLSTEGIVLGYIDQNGEQKFTRINK